MGRVEQEGEAGVRKLGLVNDKAAPWNENQSIKIHAGYRLFRWQQNALSGNHYLQLPFRFVISLDAADLAIVAEWLESQKDSPKLRARARRLRFYQCWLDPVILPPLRFVRFCLGREEAKVLWTVRR